METGARCIGIIPAQAGSFVVTLDQNREPVEYPLKCWVLVEDENTDPEIVTPSQSMYGCFSVGGSIVDDDGNLYLVPRIGKSKVLPGEKFREYKFKEPGV